MTILDRKLTNRSDAFLKNFWYVAALSEEVKQGSPFNRIILNEPIVLYRKQDGTPVAMEDRCCHRHYPLSKGVVEADDIRCGYHGMKFAPDGACVDIPGQTTIPRNCKVRTFPVVEKDTWIWIWMGDPKLASASDVGDTHWFSDPAWRGKSTVFHAECDYRLIIENLLDLTHVTFVHGSTIGNAANAYHAQVTLDREENEVRMKRWMMNVAPPPAYVKCGGFTTNIDRWQIVHFAPPALLRIYTGGCVAGTGAREGNRIDEMGWMNINQVTPETETTCHYFWGQCHNHDLDNPSMTEMVFNGVKIAFLEDVEIFSAQQRNRDLGAAGIPEVLTSHDAGAVHAIAVLDRLLEEQTAGLPATVDPRELKLGPRD
jgi:phenylpropionate dioxygenase-like ring-hydroxylating dioxygenase large terminal subunit